MNHPNDFENYGTLVECDDMRALPETFTPGPKDVICARGHKAFNHPGNQHFRSLIESHIHEYEKAATKLDKSAIVSKIVEGIRSSSPEGGFVKIEGGRWYEVGDHNAREKTGQNFRNLLHLKYKSSTKSKTKRRQKSQQMIAEVRKVSTESFAGMNSGHYSESSCNSHFDQANRLLLGQIKRSNSPPACGAPHFAQFPYGSRFAPLFQHYLSDSPFSLQRMTHVHPPSHLTTYNPHTQRSDAQPNIPPLPLESLQSDFSRSMLAEFLSTDLGPIDDIFEDDNERGVIPVTTTSNKTVHDLVGMHIRLQRNSDYNL